MNCTAGIINKQVKASNVRKIYKIRSRSRASEILTGPGKIAPFGESFIELASAVAFKGKPIASFGYETYFEEKDICDQILKDYGLDKLSDPEHNHVWLFRPENRADAFKRISEINNIKGRPESGRRVGELYGYSKADIDKYIYWSSFLTIKEYGESGQVEVTNTVETKRIPFKQGEDYVSKSY